MHLSFFRHLVYGHVRRVLPLIFRAEIAVNVVMEVVDWK